MRNVFTNRGLVEVFNKQSQSHGETSGGQMYFQYSRIYSYGSHYLLGEIIKGGAVVINDYYYSQTTRRHREYLWGATSGRVRFNSTSVSAPETLFKLTELWRKATKARTRGEFYRDQMRGLLSDYFSFLTYTKTKTAARKNKAHREILKMKQNI